MTTLTVAGTRPYPWPYDGVLEGPRTALVVTGAQHHFVAWSVGTAPVAAALEQVAGAVREAGGTVVVVRHGRTPGSKALRPAVPGRDEAAWGVEGAWLPDLVVDAAGFDGFTGSSLDLDLRARGVDHLILGGYAAEVTVDSTLRGANDRGYECLTLEDGTAPIDPDTGSRAIHSITMSGGIFGAVGTSAAVCAALFSERTPA